MLHERDIPHRRDRRQKCEAFENEGMQLQSEPIGRSLLVPINRSQK
jgi:hypothetical protein